MASWADQISQFNPYIQQLPVEAMTQVGIYKQQKYDEGIQKIQSYIDNVAGLDVVKPLQKAYLQTKLNELGSKLKTVAAGDFSNYQLVNSVGGMATQIVRDPVIQGALSDTQVYRKGQQDLETARKAGKNSIQNEAWWNKTTNDWMDDNSLDTRFNGRYIEYRDMEKKLRDVAKEIHEYDRSVEIPFRRDDNGNVLYFYKDAQGRKVATTDPSKGEKEIDDAILKMRVKGKAAQTILDNFYISLDEDDKRQLGIDGWYHYKNYTGDGFRNKVRQDIITTYNEKKDFISDRIAQLSAELASNDKLTTAQKTKLQTQIDEYSALSKGGDLDRQLAARLQSVDMADELSLKQSVYTEKFLTNLAGNIAYQDLETEYKTNPYQKALMDRKNLEYKYWNAQRQQRNADRAYGLDVLKYKLDVRKQDFTEAKELRTLIGPDYVWQESGIVTEGVEAPSLQSVNSSITTLQGDIKDFIVANRKFLIPNHEQLTDEQERKAIDDMLNSYIANPKSITDNNKRDLLERYRTLSTDLTTRLNHYNYVSDLSNKKYGDALSKTFGNRSAIVDGKGRQIYSEKEMYDALSTMRDFVKYDNIPTVPGGVPGFSPTSGSLPAAKVDEQGLLNKFRGTKYQILAEAYAKKMTGKPLSDREKLYLDKAFQIDKRVSGTVRAMYKDKKTFEATELGKLMPQYQSAVTALDMSNEENQKLVNQVIGNMSTLYNELGALDVDKRNKFNPDTIVEWRTGESAKGLIYSIKKTQDNSNGSLIIQNGKAIQEIPLKGSNLQRYFPKSTRATFMDDVKPLIMSSPTKTTNAMNDISGSEASALNARFTGEQLPLFSGTGLAPLVRFDIEGASTNDGGENDKYQLRLYVFDNGQWKSDIVNKQGFATYNGVMDMMRSIGTAEFDRIKNR